jgi:hypothetical protein
LASRQAGTEQDFDVLENDHVLVSLEVPPQILVEEMAGVDVTASLGQLVSALRIEIVLQRRRPLHKLEVAIGTLDPALEQDGAGGVVVRLTAPPRRRLPCGLAHAFEYSKAPAARQKISRRDDRWEGGLGNRTHASPMHHR